MVRSRPRERAGAGQNCRKGEGTRARRGVSGPLERAEPTEHACATPVGFPLPRRDVQASSKVLTAGWPRRRTRGSAAVRNSVSRGRGRPAQLPRNGLRGRASGPPRTVVAKRAKSTEPSDPRRCRGAPRPLVCDALRACCELSSRALPQPRSGCQVKHPTARRLIWSQAASRGRSGTPRSRLPGLGWRHPAVGRGVGACLPLGPDRRAGAPGRACNAIGEGRGSGLTHTNRCVRRAVGAWAGAAGRSGESRLAPPRGRGS